MLFLAEKPIPGEPVKSCSYQKSIEQEERYERNQRRRRNSASEDLEESRSASR